MASGSGLTVQCFHDTVLNAGKLCCFEIKGTDDFTLKYQRILVFCNNLS
jgi:hypothetical protein